MFYSPCPYMSTQSNKAFKCQQVLWVFTPHPCFYSSSHDMWPLPLSTAFHFHCVSFHFFQISIFKFRRREKRCFFSLVCIYLFADRSRHRHGKRPDISPAQVLPFALVTEKLQLSLFLVIQAVAVAHLKPKSHVSGSYVQHQSPQAWSAFPRPTKALCAPTQEKCYSGPGVSKLIYRKG